MKQEQIEREVMEGKIDEVDTYSNLGIMLNKEGNLKEHIKETGNKASRIKREMNGILSKQNVGQEEMRAKIKLFQIFLVPEIMYGFEAWGEVRCKQQKKVQNQSLKKIAQLPVTTPSTGLLMETGIWPAKERIEYSTLMLTLTVSSTETKNEYRKRLF